MRKRLKKMVLPFLAITMLVTPVSANEGGITDGTNYEEKLPYRFKEPNWEKYKNGAKGEWPLPEAPPFSTGVYSMASNNAIDYKEDENSFYDIVSKYKSSGNTEVYYTSNPSTSVTMALPQGTSIGKTVGGDEIVEFTFSDTNTPAYNKIKADNQLVLGSSQGQWLVTNGYYSRENRADGIRTVGVQGGTTVAASALDTNPWGVTGSSTFISPEDFLVSLTKSVYGTIQSRSVYMQTTPNRLAKKVTWYVIHPKVGDNCGPITWTYQVDDWSVRDVSYINPANASTSAPACGSAKTIDRGEYIVHPEGYLNNVWYRYYRDQNSFVSPNVYELYFSKLLQKGILSTDAAFANATPKDTFTPDPKNKATNFSFSQRFANKFFSEYQDFGKDVGGTSRYKYPAWATELGALYTNPELTNVEFGSNLTDKSIMITYSEGKTAFERALGVKYKLTGNSRTGVTSIQLEDEDSTEKRIMAKDTVTVINALQLIERAMRVEDGDMTNTEAAIVTKKYGPQYLDQLSEKDKQTVSYLLAKGILNFENYQEYSNLYSPLSESFAYKLMYRIANEEARLKFTEVTLTDSLDLPSLFNEYKQTIVKADLGKLSALGSLTQTGSLIKNETQQPLTLLSDVLFSSKTKKIEGEPGAVVGTRYVITANIDDPLKYLYRSMPLVNVDGKGNPYKTGNFYNVYVSNGKKIYNDISPKNKRYVGIKSVEHKPATDRYEVTFYAYGDNYQTALNFVKANLQTRIASVSTSKTETSVVSEETGTMSSTKGSDLNSSISSNNDLLINRDFGLTAYSNSKTSIVGNHLVPGASAVKVGDNIMMSLNLISKLTNTAAFETLGSKEMVSVDSGQLKGLNTTVQNPSGEVVGKTRMLRQNVSSAPSTKGNGDIEEQVTSYNLSMLKSADTLITDRVFNYTDGEGTEREVTGSIVVTWELDLPSEDEQNALVGTAVTPYVNDNAKSSWIFTRPTNKSLLEVWEYNTGINNAVLKAMSGNNLSLPSGYFVPKIDVLIDSLNETSFDANGRITNNDLTSRQLLEIENSIIKEIGQNLSAGWITTYIGNVALANHVSGDKLTKEVSKQIDEKKSNTTGVHVKPVGKLTETFVPKGRTVWSEVVFNQTRPNDASMTYFQAHSTDTAFRVNQIYSTVYGNRYYGSYFSGKGEGMQPSLDLPFVKDNFNNIYRNTESSNYSYDDKSRVLKENSGKYTPNKTGAKIKYKDQDWTLVGDEPYTYNLVSNKFLNGIMRDGKIYQSTSGSMDAPLIHDVIHSGNVTTFGTGQEKGFNSAAYMRTHAFDFIPGASTIDVGNKFVGIKDGVMEAYVYKSTINDDGSTSLKLEKTTLDEGEVVYVPSFVTLYKAVWSVEGNDLKWSKKFIGADYSLYTKGALVQGMKEQLLNKNSKNLVDKKDVKTGTLTIGNSEGTISGNEVTFLVPYSAGMVSGKSMNSDAVIASFNMNADLTFTERSETASAAQYIQDKNVGSYDPYFKNYDNTLVKNKDKLQIATGTKLTDYTETSAVQTVSLTGKVMGGVRYLNNGASSTSHNYKIYQYQTVKPPVLVAPFTNGAPPLLNVDNALIAEVASQFEGLPTASQLFDSLKNELVKIAAQSVWFKIVFSILAIAVTLSLTTLLAHVFAHSPISNLFFERLYDITGIDFLALASIGTVRITEYAQNSWVRTLKTSVLLGVIPITIFGIMRVYGMV